MWSSLFNRTHTRTTVLMHKWCRTKQDGPSVLVYHFERSEFKIKKGKSSSTIRQTPLLRAVVTLLWNTISLQLNISGKIIIIIAFTHCSGHYLLSSFPLCDNIVRDMTEKIKICAKLVSNDVKRMTRAFSQQYAILGFNGRPECRMQRDGKRIRDSHSHWPRFVLQFYISTRSSSTFLALFRVSLLVAVKRHTTFPTQI